MGFRLTPQENSFYDLFAKSASYLIDGSRELTTILGVPHHEREAVATRMHSRSFDEHDVGDAVRAIRRALGNEQQKLPPRATSTSRPLAPFAMVAALLPLGLLVWRRNIT